MEDDFDVDAIIEELLSIQYQIPGIQVQLNLKTQINKLIAKAEAII